MPGDRDGSVRGHKTDLDVLDKTGDGSPRQALRGSSLSER